MGDFNGDGKLDLAVANTAGNSVAILLGTGTGSFEAKKDFGTGSAQAQWCLGISTVMAATSWNDELYS
ncbi:MAG TPA: VCBS repeat-containing protein [Blastocatellia bacterium]|nr:VCBS repeat-containing protein [Blastocatellia bacterium]